MPEVHIPPNSPFVSISITFAPARAAATAADTPAGPPPATITSYTPATGISRDGSRNFKCSVPFAATNGEAVAPTANTDEKNDLREISISLNPIAP